MNDRGRLRRGLLTIVGVASIAGCGTGRRGSDERALELTGDDAVPASRNFAGTWMLDTSAAGRAGRGGGMGAGTGGGGGLGLGPPPTRLVIRQNSAQMVIEQDAGRATSRLTYRFDGRTVRNTVLIGGGAARSSGQYSTGWYGDTLRTTFSTVAPNGITRSYREARWLDLSGHMVVALSAGDGSGGSRVAVYRKQNGPDR